MTWTLAGRYRLSSAVASGPTGQIWRATDSGTGMPVAIKLLHRHLAADDRVVDQLLRARRSLTALWHPGVARLIDVVVSDRAVALVSDFVTGTDLARLLASSGPVTPARAASVAAAMAEALDAAHRAGLVHGDLKPSNVMLANGTAPERSRPADLGPVRVTDFSVAALVRAGRPGGIAASSSPYSAPWVIDGTVPTPASDVHALGIVLFEMLTGATSPADTAGEVDRHLLEVIDRCVLGDQTARPSAEEVARRLRELAAELPGRPAAARPAPARSKAAPARSGAAPARSGAASARSGAASARSGAAHTRTPPRRRLGLARLAIGGAVAVAVVAGAAVTVSTLTSRTPAPPGTPDGSTATATATLGAPALPAAATAPTQEGGTEFVHYWFAALTYAVRTGDTSGLAEATSPDCRDCQAAIGTIEAAYASGGELRGGEYLVRGVTTADLWTAERPVYDASVDRSPRTEVDATGAARDTLAPLTFANCGLVLEWTGERWQVREVLSGDCLG